jgi:hypothetical protein
MTLGAELVELRTRGRRFVVLVEEPECATGDAVLVLGGLGEARCGHNYALRDLGRRAVALGAHAVRFDWAGQGDSTLPFDLSLWRAQLETALDWMDCAGFESRIVARGAGCCALDDDGPDAILISPPRARHARHLATLVAGRAADALVRPCAEELDARDHDTLTALGAESRAIGGLEVPAAFVRALAAAIRPWPARWLQVVAADEADAADAELLRRVPASSALFLKERERAAVERAVAEELAGVRT